MTGYSKTTEFRLFLILFITIFGTVLKTSLAWGVAIHGEGKQRNLPFIESLIAANDSKANAVLSKSSEPSMQKSFDKQHQFKDDRSGISMNCPDGWAFMTPSEVQKKTAGAMQISPNTLVFCINDRDADQNINVQYVGDINSEAPTKDAARKFLGLLEEQMVGAMQQQLPDFKKVSSRIVDRVGGTALELIYKTSRGDIKMKQKQFALITHGKAFTIVCTAKESLFSEANINGFDPLINSIVVK